MVARLDIRPDMNALRARLARIESRLPELRRRKSMSVQELATALETAARELDEGSLANELAPVLPVVELEGLIPRLRGGAVKLVEQLRAADSE